MVASGEMGSLNTDDTVTAFVGMVNERALSVPVRATLLPSASSAVMPRSE